MQITSDATAQYLSDNIKRLHKYVVEWMPSCLVSSTSNLAEVLALGQKYHIPVLCASCIPAYPSEELPPIGFLTKPISVKWMNKSLGWGGCFCCLFLFMWGSLMFGCHGSDVEIAMGYDR